MAERVFGGRYRVTGTLGHGGMASVYRAVDEQLGREVAVKVFRTGAVDHGERARAEAEIHTLAALRSPALVTLYDAALDDADGDSYLVMELVPGSDLATRLKEGPLDPVTTARVGAQVADGLAAAHAQGVVHRDVKPANVLLESDGEHVKLADFGIALLRDAARVTGTGTVMGTAAYLAPEQVLARPTTGKADVYSLGLMLLECLTARKPFPGSAVESATARLTRGPEIDQHLPTAWRTLLHVMTSQDPDERPTAEEAARRLRALGRDETPATQLLPAAPGSFTPAAAAGAAGLGAAAGMAAAGTDRAAQADVPTQAMAAGQAPGDGVGADAPTRAMPTTGGPDAATRVMGAQPGGPDDVATTVFGAQSGAPAGDRGAGAAGAAAGAAAGGRAAGDANGAAARPGSGGAGGGAGGRGPGAGGADDRRRRRGPIILAVVVGVLVIAGIVAALSALNGRDDGPTPTESTSTAPGDQQPSQAPSEPAQQPSEPEQQPSEPEQQPSEPADQPSEPADQPSEPEQQPSNPADDPSVGPQPSSPVTNPVQSPQDVAPAADTNTGPGSGPNGGPGKSGEAPGHHKGKG